MIRFAIALISIAGAALAACAEAPTSTLGIDLKDRLTPTIESSVMSLLPARISARVNVTGACGVQIGDTSDADGDGIPTNVAVDLQGCTIPDPLGPFTLNTGAPPADRMTMADTAPEVAGFAFDHTFDVEGTVTRPDGPLYLWRKLEVTASNPDGAYRIWMRGHVYTDPTSVCTDSTTDGSDEAMDWVHAYAPASTWTTGDAPVEGTITIDGTWTLARAGYCPSAGNTHNDTWYIGYAPFVAATVSTDVPLHVNPSCATLVDAGRLTIVLETDGDPETVAITWTSCGVTETVPAS